MDTRWALAFFALGFMFLFTAMAWGFVFYETRKRIKGGVKVTARVINHTVRYHPVPRTFLKEKRYHEVYEWTVNGVRYEQVSETGDEIESKLAIGDKVEAYYRNDAPNKIVTEEDYKRNRFPILLCVIVGVISVLIGLVFQYIYMQ